MGETRDAGRVRPLSALLVIVPGGWLVLDLVLPHPERTDRILERVACTANGAQFRSCRLIRRAGGPLT